MFNIGDKVEFLGCLGEDRYGVNMTSFEYICGHRIGVVLSPRNRDYQCQNNRRIKFGNNEEWNILERNLKKLEVENDNRNEA